MSTQAQVALFICALVVIAVAVYALVRLRLLFTRAGSFEAALRVEGEQRWVTGMGVFTNRSLNWFKTRSLSHRPTISWARGNLEIKVHPVAGEFQTATLRLGGSEWTMAATPVAISAIVSWIDSLPPVEEPPLF